MSIKTVSAAAILGAATIGSLAAASLASAADNPFAANASRPSYMQIAQGDQTKGGGTSGDSKESKEGTGQDAGQGADPSTGPGANQPATQGGGMDMKGMKDGKCGEGRCGGGK